MFGFTGQQVGVWRTDLFYLWDRSCESCRGEGVVWGGWTLGMMLGLLAVVRAGPGPATSSRWLRVTTAALLPLTILQQRHLRSRGREQTGKYSSIQAADSVTSFIPTTDLSDSRPHAPNQQWLTWKNKTQKTNLLPQCEAEPSELPLRSNFCVLHGV